MYIFHVHVSLTNPCSQIITGYVEEGGVSNHDNVTKAYQVQLVYVVVHVYACACVCVCVCMHDIMYVCVCVCMYDIMYVCVCVCMHDIMYVCVCIGVILLPGLLQEAS